MSNNKNYKPMHTLLAEKLIAELKEGTSPFQRPVRENGQPSFITPVNPITGKGYSAMNALALSLKGYEDPRWLSADSARYAGFWVKAGERGTLITFPKTHDIQAVRTAEGEKIKDAEGNTQTKTVAYDKPQRGTAFLFNAEQIKDMPPLAEFLEKQQQGQTLSPEARAEKLIADSGATIIHGGQEAYYDRSRDVIFLPEKQEFASEAKYYQAAIHQLAHWSGHEDRLNRPMEGKLGSFEYAKEELRAAIAAMIIGGELKLGHNFGHHAAYTAHWTKMLKEDPYEINRASNDAQRITGSLLGVGKKVELAKDQQQEVALKKGDEIAYNGTTYKVLAKNGKSFAMEKADTGEHFKLTTTDKLYGNLVEAKTNPREQNANVEQRQDVGAEVGR